MNTKALGLIIIILIVGLSLGAIIERSDWTKLIGISGGITVGFCINELLRNIPKDEN